MPNGFIAQAAKHRVTEVRRPRWVSAIWRYLELLRELAALRPEAGELTELKRILTQQTATLLTFQNQVVNQIAAMEQRLSNNMTETRRHIVAAQINSRFAAYCFSRATRGLETTALLAPPLDSPTLDTTLKMLGERYPHLFPVYHELLEKGERAYQLNPGDNLSVYDNLGSVLFRAFCLPYLRGTVLDVGCGPVPVPVYLDGYDRALIAGIDPFGSLATHPFVFVNAVAEGIPWADESFDTLVVATSFDHFLDLSLGLSEMARVLKQGGELISWVYYVPGMPRYNPQDEKLQKVDQFHLFHLDRPWFLEMMSENFSILEELNVDGFSYFYRFLRKSRNRG